MTRPAYIFKALIGFASKVAPPAALPLSCCTATSVSGRVSLGGALSRRARLRLRSLIGARGRLPLLLQLRRCWLTGGSRAPDQPGVRGGLVAAQPPGPEDRSAVMDRADQAPVSRGQDEL